MKKHKSILVIDDDVSLREIFTMALELEGYEVTACEDGKEALDLLTNIEKHFVPDCIVTDLMMPRMSGNAFVEILKTVFPEKFAHVPIIVISAYGSHLNPAWIFEHLPKPVSLEALVASVQRSLGLPLTSENNSNLVSYQN